jgi:hypothetical protein
MAAAPFSSAAGLSLGVSAGGSGLSSTAIGLSHYKPFEHGDYLLGLQQSLEMSHAG